MGKGLSIFLDSCIIIYLIEAGEPFHSELVKQLRKLTGASGNIRFSISRLSIMECLVKPLREKDMAVLKMYETFFNAPDIDLIELDADVVDRATLLRAEFNLSPPDALQAASALSIRGDVIFSTNDKVFKRVPGLDVRII